MPQLGNTVESCLITSWLVAVGDVVDASTLLCEIETDKSAMEVPSGVAGTVLALLAAEGDEVPVKQPIVVVGEPGENVEAVLAEAGLAPTVSGEAGEVSEAETQAAPASAPAAPAVVPARAIEGEPAAVSPRARGLAASQGIAAELLAGSGPEGRVIARDVEAAIAAGPALTSGARAEASGFVPGATGTGIGGRVTRSDLAGAG
ncbi:MAG: biotin/lipoyl-containing protein, partial [Propionicimonas sp.]|nr:biotin/lipoyl-containing protein [Propionicimonas sp.]